MSHGMVEWKPPTPNALRSMSAKFEAILHPKLVELSDLVAVAISRDEELQEDLRTLKARILEAFKHDKMHTPY